MINRTTWTDRGAYTFHIGKDLGKWDKNLNAFEKLNM